MNAEKRTHSSSMNKRKTKDQTNISSAKESRRRPNCKISATPKPINSKKRKNQSLSGTSSDSQSDVHKKTEKENPKPMSTEEKLKLSQNIFKLTGKELGRLVYIVQTRELLSNGPSPEEMEIDIDALKPSTSRELERYVAACIKKRETKSS